MPPSVPCNVFLVTGTDEASIRSEADRLAHELAGEDADAFSLDTIREQDDVPVAETVNQVVRSVRSPSLLGGRKTVWLRNFTSFTAEGRQDSKTPEAKAFQVLCETITNGIPGDISLLMSGPGADARKGLALACKAQGRVIVLSKPEVRDRSWEGAMRALVRSRAEGKGVQLPQDVREYLVDVVGTDTERVDGELEKLICYCGAPENPITLAAAREICVGQGEAVSWALGNALGQRDVQESLRVVDVLIRQGQEPDRAARGLLMQAANFFRQLLQIRVFMQTRKLRSARQAQAAVEALSRDEKEDCRADGLEFVTFHRFRIGLLAEQALGYGGRELIEAVRTMRDAFWKAVSSSAAARVVLEEALIRTVPRERR